MEITIEVPDILGQRLKQFKERLPEVLERGLREVMAEETTFFNDENAVLALLASQPEPQHVLAIQPSPELQERIQHLLYLQKDGTISLEEANELDRYLLLEHLVRLAKIHAARQLKQQ